MRASQRFALFVVAWVLVAACPGPRDSAAVLDAVTAETLEPFGSAQAFDAYVDALRSARGGWAFLFGCASNAPPGEDTGGESITNNQEDGVDEGDIVKAAGDLFIVLRRGRLFTVKQYDGPAEALVPIAQVNAYPDGYTDGTWYDELLVRNGTVVVIGYSYAVSATEIGLFDLSAAGQLTHRAHYFLRSNDYYSSRNYASRLVGDTLIFYTPYQFIGGFGVTELPAMTRWVRRNEIAPWRDVVSKEAVLRPVQRTLYPTLHSIVRCDLSKPELECRGDAVVGPWSRTFYVSRNAIYLWVSSYEDPTGDSFVYRLPLASGAATVARGRGMPIDQFSFKETLAGDLNVLVASDGAGDAMWAPELTQGSLALARFPPGAFSHAATMIARERYSIVAAGNATYAIQNRFVGDHLLFGMGAGWGNGTTEERRVFVVDTVDPTQVHQLPLTHGVDRIESLGSAAVVVGTDGSNLTYSTVALGSAPAVRSSYTRPNAVQGETRSHGFFFKPDGTGGGLLGLPVRLEGAAYQHLRYGSAEVEFLAVSPGLELARAGALAATAQDPPDDQCQYSCVDWYGNARPIFYGGRIFALLGYELVEGRLESGALVEARRAAMF